MEKELNTYRSLNALAKAGGLVIFGGAEDRHIPLCELKQAFNLQNELYNRSVAGLSLDNAIGIYNDCVAPLHPEDVCLHIGREDRKLFSRDSAAFDQKLRQLLRYIKRMDEKCRIAVIALKDHDGEPVIGEMNQHLAAVAESEQCRFCDISKPRVWNPRQMRDVMSFVYDTGFVRPLNKKRPLYDLVKILFCYA